MRSRPPRPRRRPTLPVVLALAAAAGLAVAAPAAARTYFVSGHQIPAGPTSTIMRGGLIGTWTFPSTSPAEEPVLGLPLLFRLTGTELFVGCLNRHRDGSCRHDPMGTLTFYNDTWALAASPPTPHSFLGVWGACVHPVLLGTDGFAGAQGVITMIDTYTPDGVYINTRYDGNIILPDQRGAAAPPQPLTGSPAQPTAAPQAPATGAPHQGCGTG